MSERFERDAQPRIDPREDVFRSVRQFLYREAERLDDNDLAGWFDLLTEDVEYRIPVRLTKERFSETTFSDESYFMNEDYTSLKARIDRLQTDFAWSEDPPSRTRRFVSNVRIVDDRGEEVDVKNNFMIQRNQGDTVETDLLTAERHDTLRIVDGEWNLARRTVYLDHTILDTDSLSIFL